MKVAFIFLFLQSSMLWSQQTESVKTYHGVVNYDDVQATFTVEKILWNDSVVWSYIFLHHNDTTIYSVKYSIKGGLAKVNYNGDDWSLSDSLDCNDEYLYVFDFNLPNEDVVGGFFCVSPTFGVVSIGDFRRADYLEFQNYPHFNSCIERYREERAIHN